MLGGIHSRNAKIYKSFFLKYIDIIFNQLTVTILRKLICAIYGLFITRILTLHVPKLTRVLWQNN